MSTTNKPAIVKCPTCKRPVFWSSEQKFKPFCSERCKLIDLGEWASEKNIIPGESLMLDSEDQNSSFH